MKFVKSIALFTAAAMLTLSLVACGGEAATSEKTPETTNETVSDEVTGTSPEVTSAE